MEKIGRFGTSILFLEISYNTNCTLIRWLRRQPSVAWVPCVIDGPQVPRRPTSVFKLLSISCGALLVMEVFHFKFRFPQIPSASGFCNHSLSNSYTFVFHCFFYRSDNSTTRLYVIRNEEPGEACLNQVKARYVLFTFLSKTKLQDGLSLSMLKTKSYVVTIQMKPLWLNV